MADTLSRRLFLTAGAGALTLPVLSHLAGCKGNEQLEPEAEKKIFVEPKFELLDLALQHEFGAVVQYGNHAGVIAAIGRDSDGTVAKMIEKIISQEVHHAILLTGILKKNNIEPTIAVWPPQTAVTSDAMIEKDIAAERGAIKLYQQILALDFDDQTKKVIEQLLRSEEIHYNMFSTMLPELS